MGELIKSARSIDVLQIPDESDWERCHTATSEPYFYDQSQALEDIDSGCTYRHYSIPWEIIAAKYDKLAAASDDSKQFEDSKPVSNGTLSEDSKPADVPTNDSKLLEEGKPADADSTLPIHKEDEKRVDVSLH